MAKETESQEGPRAFREKMKGKICLHASGREAGEREKRTSRAWRQRKFRSDRKWPWHPDPHEKSLGCPRGQGAPWGAGPRDSPEHGRIILTCAAAGETTPVEEGWGPLKTRWLNVEHEAVYLTANPYPSLILIEACSTEKFCVNGVFGKTQRDWIYLNECKVG